MVDAFKVLRDFSKVKLDELFSKFELHKQSNATTSKKDIALFASKLKKETKSEPQLDESELEDDDETATELVNLVWKLFKKKKGLTKEDIKKVVRSKKT